MPTLADIRLPTRQQMNRYLRDPEIVTSEILFLLLTLSNVFIVYRLFLDVLPYPIFVTWWQLAQGLLMAYVLGETGREFPKFAYFPRVEIDQRLLKRLVVPTIVNAIMLVLGNVLLYRTPCVATIPVVVSLAVVLHHITRFVGCGEEYMAMRWQSIGLLFGAFLLGCTDPKTVGYQVLPWAIMYAIFSAAFRAAFLQKVMHDVEGKGNLLHNHQHLIGVALLPVLILLGGDIGAVASMPLNFTNLFTWQTWGCLFTVGSLPFLKNIVSNRLIRRTGQGPWRALEVISMVLVFLIGISFGAPGWQGWFATLLVVGGRTLGACDVLLNAAEADRQREIRGGGYRESSNPEESEPAAYDSADPNQKDFLQAIEEDSAEAEAYGEVPESDEPATL